MPTDRIFKFSVPGLMFLLTSIFFYDLLGGELDTIIKWTKERDLIPLFVLIFSTPIIGVIFSTITLWVLQKVCGYEILYYPPTSLKIVKYVLKDNPALKEKIILNEKVRWTTDTLKREFYPYYQAELREHLRSEQIEFLDRRWSAYWTHVNNISVTIFSFLVIGILRLTETCGSCCAKVDPAVHKIVGIAVILGYFGTGYASLKNSKGDATRTEHAMLEKAIDKQQESEDRMNSTKGDNDDQVTWTSILTQLLKLIK